MASDADFWRAIAAGDRGTVEAFVRADPRLATARHDGASAILIATYHYRPEVVACLRPHVVELNIFEAAALGELDRVEALLASDAGLANAVAGDGFGPLGLASFFDHAPVAVVLLEAGARVDEASANAMRVMPLHSAAAAKAVRIAEALLVHGAPVNARQGAGDVGFTPLMEAAYNGQAAMVDLLLRHGADPAMRDGDGKTAWDHALLRGHVSLAESLGART